MSAVTTYAKMKEVVALVAGWDRTTANWSTDRDNLFETLKKDALSRFEGAYPWSFLYKWASLELTPAYETGTIAIASGVVTLTGGTFPSWAAQGDLWVEDDDETRRYSVSTRDGNTQITLNDTSVAVTAGATYALKRHFYDLPSDFGGTLDRGFAFRRDSVYAGHVIKLVGLSEYQQLDREVGTITGAPRYCALQADSVSSWLVGFTPLPTGTLFLDYRYKLVPADVTSGNSPYGGGLHAETILASLRYSTALHLEKPSAQAFLIEYERKLRDSIRMNGNFRPVDYGPGDVSYHHYGCDSGDYWNASIDDATLFT